MKIIENFIGPSFIQQVLKENEDMMYDNVWRSNLGWQEEIVAPSGVVLIRSLSPAQIESLTDAMRKHGLVQPHQSIEIDAQAYVWHRLSYIPWHSDKDSDDEVRFAASLYLNREWNDDWGGLFLYKKEGEIRAEAPEYGKLVFNDNNFPHATSMLSVDAPYRHSVQLFWKVKS
jgi:Rps23 Pro-64 3,4-dihydroxylase Tpa1-like proline 4-hydroxylase